MGDKIHRNSLKPGHKLHWYEIKEILGQGGFGITYLAHDTNLDEDVAIKEYLPIELAVREGDFSVHPVSEGHSDNYHWGLERFITEARTLTKFKHPNIVRVRSVFEDNNTAYMVMEYEKGMSLQEKLTGKKTLEEPELLKILIPILGGLEQVHATGFIHRDIKPDNIFIRNDGSPVLLDFGSARQALGEQTKTLTSLVTPGYAPFEQYFSKSDEQGPWTDIYGIGATLYRAVTGIAPINAVDRSKAIHKTSRDTLVTAMEIGKGKYSDNFLKAIDHAIQFNQEDRPQSIHEWKEEFGVREGLAEIEQLQRLEKEPTRPGTRVVTKRVPSKFRFMTPTLLIVLLAIIVGFNYREQINTWIQPQLPEIIPEPPLVKPPTEDKVKQPASLEQQQIDEAQIQQQKVIELLLEKAGKNINEGKFIEPSGNNALGNYLKVLELDPENTDALAGKKTIFKHFLDLADNLIKGQKFSEADAALIRADAIEPDSVEVRLARIRLKETKVKVENIAREEEQKRVAEEEAKRKAEEERVAEMERKRKEELAQQEEARLKAEAEQQKIAQKKRVDETELARLEEDEIVKIGEKAKTDTSSLEELIRLADFNNPHAQNYLGNMYLNGLGGLPKDERIARELYEQAAAQDDSLGQYNLGAMYEYGLGGLSKDERKARELYEQSAAQGNAFGQNNLGYMYLNGLGGLSKDERKARELYEQSAAQGDSFAQYNLGWMYENGKGGLSKDDRKAREYYEKSAAQGYSFAQSSLGYMYLNGLGGLPKDERKARELYEQSAAQGDSFGQYNLGWMYANGKGGLPKDERKARELYEQSAAQDNALAQNNLGYMYLNGLGGLTIDERKAREFYEQSAAQGDSFGQYNLGWMYANGQGGLPKDERKARDLYEKSAAQGNALGQNNLGNMYLNGQGGLPVDKQKAVELYEKSAAQGDSFGQFNLGWMYANGQGGLSVDERKARDLYEKSAAQGNALGQNNLGWMYENGLGGLPKDKHKAREYYEKSAAQGNINAIENLKSLR